MYGTEGTRCSASGTAGDPAPGGGSRVVGRYRDRACPVCGQSLWCDPTAPWPEHHVAPPDRPARVVHRNDDADLLDARDASCTTCARCDHEPDDPRCFDFCSDPALGPWLPAEAAWACDSCTHPVIRPALKHAVTGTW